VVDLGFGSSPITTVELTARLLAKFPTAQVLGLEIDPARVAAAAPAASPPGLTFARGGFELAGTSPVVVRAMNVLRQYDERAVRGAWAQLCATGASVIDGTCDEIGRRARNRHERRSAPEATRPLRQRQPAPGQFPNPALVRPEIWRVIVQ
jgi:hypothetical protein